MSEQKLIINSLEEFHQCIDDLSFQDSNIKIEPCLRPEIISEIESNWRGETLEDECVDYTKMSDNELADEWYDSAISYCQHRGLM